MWSLKRRVASLLVAAAAVLPHSALAADVCESLAPPAHKEWRGGPVTPELLAQIRDIGPATLPDRRRKLFAISPDGKSIAFFLHRGFPKENHYCVGLAILSLEKPTKVSIVDSSRELIRDEPPRYGWAKFPIGTPAPVTPRWEAKGRWIAYLKREHGLTQVWRVNIRTGAASQVTHSPVNVDDFRISGDGRTIVYSSRPKLPEKSAEIDQEGLTGWRFDRRAFPVRGARPQTPDADRVLRSVDLEKGLERDAHADETNLFDVARGLPGNTTAYSKTAGGSEAWAEATEAPLFPPLYRLMVKRREKLERCEFRACEFDWSTSIWWNDQGTKIRFSRREGWANSLTGVYEWVPGQGKPKRIFLTTDALIECQPLADDLLCLREQSRRPRHFVRLQVATGQIKEIFDPNPEFSDHSLGRVERLNWLNGMNVPFYADLVYPVGYEPGRRYSLVIVQYRTKGFLRGGIGDEVPIQALAGRGYFILSADNLTYEDIVGRKESIEQLVAAFNDDFRGRRNILSAIEIATRRLIDKGLVDPRRIGISGLSDGCTTVQFAAVNSELFSAGSVSGCGWEPFQDAILGPMIAENYHESGWPRLADASPGFWSKISIIHDPRRVRFPFLFQAADNEYLAMVGGHTALIQAGIPSDLYIFPNEDHIKWQPAHRLAVYERNIDWFDFWLRDLMPGNPARRAEAERWSEMKASWKRSIPK